jgi:carboxyl-terminal processing protease
MMEKKYSKYEIWQPFLLASMVAIGMIVGQKINSGNISMIEPISADNIAAGPIGRVEEIVRFIETKYVDSLNSDEILENAIADIIDDLDPHSIYLSKEQLGTISEQMEGSYRGIGVESFYLDDTVRISRVIKGSPAEKAGILPLDKLVAIGDSSVAGKGLDYSIIRKMLRADFEDELQLKVFHDNSLKIEVLTVAPSDIELFSSNVFFEIADDVGYIKIERFSSKTYKEFMEALESLIENDEIKHLIIDVRDNPGGYLPETVNILSQLFNEKGKLLVYTAGKDGKKTEYKSSGKNFFEIDKIAVLIDEGSASGSEIIAGAIQDWDRGLIIGRRSFGKGLVQEQYRLNNGGAIRLTTARYYTPSGRSIQKPYDQDEAYDEDIHKRFLNGEMFEKNKFVLGDSTEFKTLLYNRDVYGGGGISPDVFIPLDSSYSYYDLSQVSAYIPEYIFRTRMKGEILNDSDIENIKEFRKYLQDSGLKTDTFVLNETLINARLRAEWAYQLKSPIEKEKVLLMDDKFIKIALEYFESNEDLRAYK